MDLNDTEPASQTSTVQSGARVGELRAGPGQLPVPTPAPLLLTSRGQLPYLSRELFERTLSSSCPPLLFQLPLADWYCLNPNNAVLGAEIISAAGSRGGVAAFAALPDLAVAVLSTRAAASPDFLTKTPGNSLSISTDSGSHRPCISPSDVVTLYRSLRTRFVEAPSDAPFLQSSPPWPPARTILRSLARADRLLKATFEALDVCSNSTSPESPPALLIPVQGGIDMVQRAVAASHAAETFAIRPKEVGGFVISGLYAGESPIERWTAVDAAVAALPTDPPRFLAGSLGSPSDVLEAVARGIDVIDSAYPFRIAADGCALDLERGTKICLRDREFERSSIPLLPGCQCLACGDGARTGSFYSRAYIRHMLDVHEMLGATLLAAHNLRNYLDWFQRMRDAVAAGRFSQFRLDFYKLREEIRTGEEALNLHRASSKLDAVASQ